MADYGIKNSPLRTKWYDEVFVPLRRVVQAVAVESPGGIGPRAEWLKAGILQGWLRGNPVGKAYHRRIQANFNAAAQAVGLPTSDMKWGSVTAARATIQRLQEEVGQASTDALSEESSSTEAPVQSRPPVEAQITTVPPPPAVPNTGVLAPAYAISTKSAGMSGGGRLAVAVGGLVVASGLFFTVQHLRKPPAERNF